MAPVDRQLHAPAVHRATPTDAAVMSAIHASCLSPGWDEATMSQFLVSPGVLCLMGAVAEIMATPGGLLIARRADDEAELLTLAVAPPCRRAGLGRALLKQAIGDLRTSGATQLFLEVDEGNEAALALYRAFGARPVGRRPGYYESGANALIFSLALSESPSDDGQIAEEPHDDQR
jgi:[ribosomal protein S18]-alanine N-acetyltransferase